MFRIHQCTGQGAVSHGAYTPRTFLFESCKFSVVVLNHVGLGALSELWSRSRNIYVCIAICTSGSWQPEAHPWTPG